MPTEDDVRHAIATILEDSGYFDDVFMTGLPKMDDQSAEDLRACAILPSETTEDDRYDTSPGGLIVLDARVKIVFVARDQDPLARDKTVNLLLLYAQNALNGESLAGITLPDFTRFKGGWRWEDPVPPERKITAMFSFRYLVQGWKAFDTTDTP